MVVSAAVGAGVMAGASMMARPNQINSGDDAAEIVVIVITSVLIIMLSPVICMQCKQWMKWMKGSESARDIKKEKDDPFKINQVVKKIQDAEDNKNIVNITITREEVSQKLTKYNPKTTASSSSIKYSKEGASMEKACIKNGDIEEREEEMSKENSLQ